MSGFQENHSVLPATTSPTSSSDFRKTSSGFNTSTSTSNPTTSTTSTNGNATLQNAKDTVVANAQSAMSAVQNHPMTQSIANGPVAENIKDQSAKTTSEFSDLAASRQTPNQRAATGQQLTHYHSAFYSLLSWKHPRATGITYAACVAFIFAARYLPVLKYAFKGTWMVLGITAAAEIAGKTIFSNGLTSQIRPKRYYTLPKEALENAMDDMHQLINFFVLESQRLVFAENVFATVTAFFASLIAYFLIKIVPLWGVSLIATTVFFIAPLIYVSNKELIDSQVAHASRVLNKQTAQVKDITVQQTARATENIKQYAGDASATVQQYAGDYTAKAQEYMGNARPTSPNAATKDIKSELTSGTSSGISKPTGATTTSSGTSSFSKATGAKSGLSGSSSDFSSPLGSTTTPSANSMALPSHNTAGSSTFNATDFPTAPKDAFKSTPIADSFGSHKNTLGSDKEPLLL